MFCGLPGEGVHSVRIFGFAFFDLLITIVAAFILNKWLFHANFWLVLVVFIFLGIFTHKMLGIKTKLNSMIFKEDA